jgi:hypothetical protein
MSQALDEQGCKQPLASLESMQTHLLMHTVLTVCRMLTPATVTAAAAAASRLLLLFC